MPELPGAGGHSERGNALRTAWGGLGAATPGALGSVVATLWWAGCEILSHSLATSPGWDPLLRATSARRSPSQGRAGGAAGSPQPSNPPLLLLQAKLLFSDGKKVVPRLPHEQAGPKVKVVVPRDSVMCRSWEEQVEGLELPRSLPVPCLSD